MGGTQVRNKFYSPFSVSQIFQCPTQVPASIAPELQVRLYCFYIPKISTPHKLSFSPINKHIQSLYLDKSRVDQKRYKGQYVYGFFIILCWSVYYSILNFFVWNYVRIFIRFALATPLATPPCTPVSLIFYLPTIWGCQFLNSMYTLLPSL